MAKKTSGGIPTVSIRLGGKKHTLRLDFGAFYEAERLTGTNMMTAPLHRINVGTLTALVWAAIDHRGKPEDKISLAEVRSQMGPHNVATIQAAIIEAINESLPDPEPIDDPEAAEGNGDGTGTRS